VKPGLIDRIKARANDPNLRTSSGRADERPLFLPKPAPAAVIADAERKLGFKLPDLLRTLYEEIANGGFGPSYGIIGLDENGWLDVDLNIAVPELYLGFREQPEDWPERLLPICNRGCAGYSAIDCTSPLAEVLFSEGPEFELEGGFEQWMERWANGESI